MIHLYVKTDGRKIRLPWGFVERTREDIRKKLGRDTFELAGSGKAFSISEIRAETVHFPYAAILIGGIAAMIFGAGPRGVFTGCIVGLGLAVMIAARINKDAHEFNRSE